MINVRMYANVKSWCAFSGIKTEQNKENREQKRKQAAIHRQLVG